MQPETEMKKLTFLNLRCAICDKVSQSEQSVEELANVDADYICMSLYICKECLDDGDVT